MSRILFVALAALAFVVGVGVAIGSDGDGGGGGDDKPKIPTWPAVERAPASQAKDKPNIVFIYSDDQNASDFKRRFMPLTYDRLVDGGTNFSNFVVAAPVCCPSRVGFMTGDYPHNSGVYMNHDGFPSMRAKEQNIGSWMQRAGYHTAWLGKFLQGYKRVIPDPNVPAPGWDSWQVSLRANYFGWELYTNHGTQRGGASDYYTDTLTNRASRLVTKQLGKRRPLFMVLNELAPHKGHGGHGSCANTAAPAPRDYGKFADEPLPRPPSFNEPDRSDKTAFVAEGELGKLAIRQDRDRYRCRLETLQAMDRGIARIYDAVKREGEIDNTIFVFTSDNGLLIGEHALDGKDIPYEEGIRMPMALRVPKQLLGKAPVGQIGDLTANIDLTPTLLELAGADPCLSDDDCRTLDGRSLTPLLRGNSIGWPADRAIPIEGGVRGDVCGFRGLRLKASVLLEDVVAADEGTCVQSNEPEYYDLDADPYQLDNLLVTDPQKASGTVDELLARMEQLQSCSGIEGRDPPTPGGFCD